MKRIFKLFIMYTFIILAFIGIFLGLFIQYKYKENYTENSDFCFSALFGFLFSILFSIIISILIPIKTKIEKTICKIESLQDNNSINGRFFIGSGFINSNMVYTLYLKEQDGFKLYQLNSDIVTIKYSNNEPTLEIYDEIITNDWINNFSVKNPTNFYYVIKVPKGTICNNFNLDAE